MRRLPLSLVLLTIFAAILGIWMTFEGLFIRLFGDYLPFLSLLGSWIRINEALMNTSTPLGIRLEPQTFAWPLIAVGLSWTGALSALWLKLEWGYKVTNFVAALSLLTIGYGSILAALVLVCLHVTPTRFWLGEPEKTYVT